MWPLISPASGAPVSFIFDLIRLWPVFHINGVPPIAAMPSNSIWLALTSAMMVAPGCSSSTGAARIISNWSPQITRPWPSTAPMRSPSPSNAIPKSSCLVGDERLQVGEVGFDGRVGMVVGKGAVDLGEDGVMLAGEALEQLLEHVARRAIAGVPADAETCRRGNLRPAGRHRPRRHRRPRPCPGPRSTRRRRSGAQAPGSPRRTPSGRQAAS